MCRSRRSTIAETAGAFEHPAVWSASDFERTWKTDELNRYVAAAAVADDRADFPASRMSCFFILLYSVGR